MSKKSRALDAWEDVLTGVDMIQRGLDTLTTTLEIASQVETDRDVKVEQLRFKRRMEDIRREIRDLKINVEIAALPESKTERCKTCGQLR